jgi:hypothetical protein
MADEPHALFVMGSFQMEASQDSQAGLGMARLHCRHPRPVQVRNFHLPLRNQLLCSRLVSSRPLEHPLCVLAFTI